MANVIEDINDMFFNRFDKYYLNANFYLTRHCNLACPDCYMHASPTVPKTMIPSEDVKFYLRELNKCPNFVGSAVFTGGEIFTCSMDYLQQNIQYAFDNGLSVELKTNAKKAETAAGRKEIFDMVRGLNIPENLFTWHNRAARSVFQKMSDVQRLEYLKLGFSCGVEKADRYLANIAEQEYHIDLIKSPLLLTVSADNLIHPKESWVWYDNLLQDIVNDNELRKKVCLARVTVDDAKEQRNYFDIKQGYVCYFASGGRKIDPNGLKYFGENWIYKPIYENGKLARFGCMNLSFWPNRTAGIESELNFQPIGCVSYINPDGSYKPISVLMMDIKAQLLRDYEQKR